MKDSAKGKSSNRLANEKSPYLLQHAENPVDWFTWNDEAFEKALTENKPIFLSIGYSTCHWCHVMAHESFEDEEVATLMNDAFVNIKVDREERPDIDGVYMQVAQMLTGRGGWPLTIIMTPNKKPFYAATYIPKESRYNMLGMKELVQRIKELWTTKQENIDEVITQIEEALSQPSKVGPTEDLTLDDLNLAYSQLSQRFDEKKGGFGPAPKFPSPHNLMLILRYWKRTRDERALYMVEKTLQEMRLGGFFDHLGFGFHRYSTDAEWLLPHFEKMLYDQAGLMMAYTEAYQITRKEEYADVVRGILEYVVRDLSSPDGAFYSAQDADSEGEEGKFYTWKKNEIEDVLEGEVASIFTHVYNVHEEGNFDDEATGKTTGFNILHLKQKADIATDLTKMSREDLTILLDNARTKLFIQREKRVRPSLDDKILTDWNGFMIAALAKAAVAIGDEKIIEVAEKALSFILETMLDENRGLLHRYKDGDVAIGAFLDDYAYLIWALLEIYEATFKPEYLEQAKNLTDDLIKNFLDEEGGAFYFTSVEAEELLVRKKDAYDGAMPSGNSVAMYNLIRLARLLGENNYEDRATAIGNAFSMDIKRAPSAYSMMLLGLDFALGPSFEIVIAGNPEMDDTREMIEQVRKIFIPRKVVLLRGTQEQSKAITKLAPFTKFHEPLNDKATAHVCVDHNCRLPTTELSRMMELLDEKIH
ncbi:MAG: thioredoxin domain-containing protein [Candidatus Thorarchaeota archaeon]|nr:MAG: thioredoxin domain-containing protein [Candidatus Thorarchaeota archaeon]